MENDSINELSPEDLNEAVETDTLITKCSSCGGNMLYDPESRGLKCEYCGNVVALSFNKQSRELDLEKLFSGSNNEWGKEVHVFKCNNCGAKEVVSSKEISKKCAFCGTSNVVETDDVSGLKPNAIIPFTVTMDNACEIAVKWAKKKFFAPKQFKDMIQPEEVSGSYYPAFTFDAASFSRYSGVLGKYYYVTVKRNGKTYQERKVRWFKVSGSHNALFNDVLVQACEGHLLSFTSKLPPYDTNHSQEYNPDFLQGFSASQYNRDGRTCWNDAVNFMKNRIRAQILAKYNHDTVRYLDVNTQFENKTFKYLMLPSYIGHLPYKNKLYNFYVNGQTGKIIGKTPVSILKVSITVLIVLLAIFAVFAFIWINDL